MGILKLSMWILHDWLAPLGAVAEIREGQQILRNARHFAGEEHLERQNVYVGPDGSGQGGVICAHGHDLIRVPVEDVDVVFNQVLRAFDFYNGWMDGLREKIQAGCRLVELLEDSDPVFDDPLSILDAGYTTVAVSERYAQGRSFDQEWVYMIRNRRMRMDFIRSVNETVLPRMRDKAPFLLGVRPYDCLCQNLFVHGRLVGWVGLILEKHRLTRGREMLLSALGSAVEEWLRLNEDQARLLEDTDFLCQLFQGVSFSRPETEHRLNVMGYSPADPKVVIKISGGGGGLDLRQPICAALSSALAGCTAVPLEGGAAALANLQRKPLALLETELGELLGHMGVSAGLSCVFTDAMLLRRHYLQADVALRYGGGAPGTLHRCYEHAVRYMADLLADTLAADMIHPDIPRLQAYDAVHGTEFCETLRQYLACERSLNGTAAAMCLHRNTLYYRLTRLRELMDGDLDQSETRLHLQLSFLLLSAEKT